MAAQFLSRSVAYAAPILLAAVTLHGCSEANGLSERPETWEQRAARQQAEFDASPDIQLPELRARLSKLGVPQSAMKQVVEDHGVAVLELRPDDRLFDRLDKAELARLVLDSRFRFDFVEPRQVRTFAQHVRAEIDRRDTAKARREIEQRGEAGRVPVYRPGTPMAAYARRLERYCGYGPGQALGVVDDRWLEYRPSMPDLAVKDPRGPGGADSFDCMKRAVDALELRRHFIGNRGEQGATAS